MPKLGIKCFLGSFLLSLVAVFVATKAYVVLSLNDTKTTQSASDLSTVPPHNIELFAAREENDPLYDKFKQIEQRHDDDLSGLATAQTAVTDSSNTQTAHNDTLYSGTGEDSSLEGDVEPITEMSESTEETPVLLAQNEKDNIQEEELKIADAATAPNFTIPLIHHFKTAAGTVTVSDNADTNQIAMASHDVNIDNLGTDKKAAVTEEIISSIGENAATTDETLFDDPWDVAETANEHASKNTIKPHTSEHSSSISAMDQSQTKQIAENEQVPYKMQKNLLVPIPEDIANETDMTPQLSTSSENKKIEAELRAKKKLPQPATTLPREENNKKADVKKTTVVAIDGEDEEEDIDDETSRSLSESIAAWFSSGKDKEVKKKEKKIDSQSNRDQGNSIFQKLLGIGSDSNNVIPTELKLAFQPNRAEISGQTLEWLHAFSDNAVKFENVVVEIRLSNTAPYDLQQKRLKLLYRILANNGVEYDKVNIIFTDREPNSFIIRNVRYATEEEQRKAIEAKAYSPWY